MVMIVYRIGGMKAGMQVQIRRGEGDKEAVVLMGEEREEAERQIIHYLQN